MSGPRCACACGAELAAEHDSLDSRALAHMAHVLTPRHRAWGRRLSGEAADMDAPRDARRRLAADVAAARLRRRLGRERAWLALELERVGLRP